MANNQLKCGHNGPDWNGKGDCIKCARDKILGTEKTRQEEAFEYVSQNFTKLLMADMKMPHDRKKDVIAFWTDVFEYEGTRDNMIQAFSNFLFEIDEKMDAARKAGIRSVKDSIDTEINLVDYMGTTEHLDMVDDIIKRLLAAESTYEEKTIDGSELENMDLSEVGGGDEDDTSPL